jgi:hypothetical protein
VFFGPITLNFLQEDNKLRFGKYLLIFKKFSKTRNFTWCSKKLVSKKSGTIYPTEQRCLFFELAIFLIKYCMLLTLYFKIIFNFWSIKNGFKNLQNQWGKLQKNQYRFKSLSAYIVHILLSFSKRHFCISISWREIFNFMTQKNQNFRCRIKRTGPKSPTLPIYNKF